MLFGAAEPERIFLVHLQQAPAKAKLCGDRVVPLLFPVELNQPAKRRDGQLNSFQIIIIVSGRQFGIFSCPNPVFIATAQLKAAEVF